MGLSVRQFLSRRSGPLGHGCARDHRLHLRRLRVAQGLSQERLALAAGIDRAYVGRVERGSENVTITTLEALARALAVSVSMLFVEPAPDAVRLQPLRAGRWPRGANSR